MGSSLLWTKIIIKGLFSFCIFQLSYIAIRVSDPHFFFADPDPGKSLHADPDPVPVPDPDPDPGGIRGRGWG